MGPFLAGSSGETTEWCDSGVEGWEEAGRRGGKKDKEAEERGEEGGRRKERGKEEGADGRF